MVSKIDLRQSRKRLANTRLATSAGATGEEIINAIDAAVVLSPTASTTNAIPKFSSTSGKDLTPSSIIIDASNNITGAGSITAGSLAVTTPVPLSSGGTGSATQNFVDISTTQASIAGAKTFTTSIASPIVNSTGVSVEAISTDSTTTGTGASLAAFTTPTIRLTNTSLVDLAMIPAPSLAGTSITIINKTGVSINVDNLVGATAANQILTGTGAVLALANNASIFLTYDGTSSKWNVIGGSGSGTGSASGGYITSFNAETGSVGWATYNNTAGAAPVTGTGGSPVVTFATSADTTMRGSYNFLFTKSATNRQGDGFSYDFTIDGSDTAKILQCSLEYKIASGTYADGDLTFWIYDKTNGVMIQPAPTQIKNSGIIEKFAFEFQTASNSTSYRLICHVSSTSALAYSLRFDSFNLSAQTKSYGSAVTDWVAYTPTLSAGFGTTSAVSFFYKREGDTMYVKGNFTTGTIAASLGTITLPNSLTIDSTKVIANNISSAAGGQVGILQSNSAPGTVGQLPLITATGTSTSLVYVGFLISSAGSLVPNNLATSSISNSSIQSVNFQVPIQGWSSSQVMSSDADTRVVAAIITGTVSGTLASLGGETVAKYPTIIQDTHSGYSAATGLYTVKVPGFYTVLASAQTSFTSGTPYLYGLIYQNSSIAVSQYFYQASASDGIPRVQGKVYCIAGDTISVHFATNAASPIFIAGNANQLSIERLAGPASIAASESVNALYINSVGTTYSATGVPTVIPFATKEYDTHNAFSGNTFTAPMSGKYSITVQLSPVYTSVSAGNNIHDIFITTSGTGSNAWSREYYVGNAPNSSINSFTLTKTFNLLAGQTLTISATAGYNAGSVSLFNDARMNYVSISRVGN